jgi:hypothetical protein
MRIFAAERVSALETGLAWQGPASLNGRRFPRASDNFLKLFASTSCAALIFETKSQRHAALLKNETRPVAVSGVDTLNISNFPICHRLAPPFRVIF